MDFRNAKFQQSDPGKRVVVVLKGLHPLKKILTDIWQFKIFGVQKLDNSFTDTSVGILTVYSCSLVRINIYIVSVFGHLLVKNRAP